MLLRGATGDEGECGDFIELNFSIAHPVFPLDLCLDSTNCLPCLPLCSAEEHLPNTLRQVLIYDALNFQRPIFAHVSLILAPDKSKLSKR